MEVDKVSETRPKLLKASQQVSRTCQSGIMMEAPVIRYNMINQKRLAQDLDPKPNKW